MPYKTEMPVLCDSDRKNRSRQRKRDYLIVFTIVCEEMLDLLLFIVVETDV